MVVPRSLFFLLYNLLSQVFFGDAIRLDYRGEFYLFLKQKEVQGHWAYITTVLQ